MRQIIVLGTGQSGSLVTQTMFYQLNNQQHSKQKIDEKINIAINNQNNHQYPQIYFRQNKYNQRIARSIFVDLDTSQLDNIRFRNNQAIFPEQNLICDNLGSSNIWAKAYYTHSSHVLNIFLDSLRRQLQQCESLQAIQSIHSIAGGTGSGLASLFQNQISAYSNKMIHSCSIFPSIFSTSNNCVQIYNASLSFVSLMINCCISSIYDNQSIQKILFSNQKKNRKQLNYKNYNEINRMISSSILGLTAGSRYSSDLNNNLLKIATNMVPFPRLHFFSVSHYSKPKNSVFDLKQTIWNLMHKKNLMCNVDPSKSRYLTISANFRSNFSSFDIQNSLNIFKNHNSSSFVEWIQNNFIINQCSNLPKKSCIEATCLFNSTSMRGYFQKLSQKFSLMFKRKSFLHWYTSQGMDEMQFTEAQSHLYDMISEYPAQYDQEPDPDFLDIE